MKTIPALLKTDFASNSQTIARRVTITRRDGVVIRATSNSIDVTVDGQTYYVKAMGTAKDIAISASLDVANSEFHGFFHPDFVTFADCKAGLYDRARIGSYLFNSVDTTRGSYPEHKWTVGAITLDRYTFVFKLRGIMQLLQLPIGRNVLPLCPYILGDSDCTRSLADLTVTGSIDGASADQLTLYDAARTEAGPAGGISITAVSNANPCVITLASVLAQSNGAAVMFSGIVGPDRLNGVHTVRNKSGLTFEIDVDTTNATNYPPYVGSGKVTAIVDDTGIYGYGLITITSGANAGIPREVKAFATGQIVLQEPFPYAIAGGETYSLIQGCNKTGARCLELGNKKNFGGFEFVPGQDSQFEVGRAE